HLAYERYLIEEVLPAIRYANAVDQLIVAGSSFGAFHALAFVTRRPGIARKAVGMSGAYDTARWLDGERGGEAYFVNPLAFLPNLNDDRFLAPLRQTEIIIATGRDDPHVDDQSVSRASCSRRAFPPSSIYGTAGHTIGRTGRTWWIGTYEKRHMSDRVVGILIGRENTFPGPFIETVNRKGASQGVHAEMAVLGGAREIEPQRDKVIVDR